MARRLVTSSMTSRDYDVIPVTSQSSKSSHSQRATRINCGHLSTYYRDTLCKKSAHSA